MGQARGRGSSVATAVATLASMMLHAGAAAALLYVWPQNDLGAVDVATDAISIELVASSVTDQAEVTATSEASGANASVAQTAGSETDSRAVQETAKPVVQETQQDLPDVAETEVTSLDPAVAKPDVENVIAGSAETEDSVSPQDKLAQPKKSEPQRSEQRREAKPEPRSKPERDVTEHRSAENSTKGGVTSKASAASKNGVGRVSASTGNILGYAARVRARVASNKPPGGGRVGTAVVSFGVTSSGGLGYVRLARSSGDSGLDQAALSAVRRAAPFPQPPSGAAGRQLAFSVPFHFR